MSEEAAVAKKGSRKEAMAKVHFMLRRVVEEFFGDFQGDKQR